MIESILNALLAVLVSIVMAIVWSMMAYGKSLQKALKNGKDLEFLPSRMMRTVVQAVFIGIVLWAMGLEVNVATMEVGWSFITASGILVVWVDIVVILVLRKLGWELPLEETEGIPTEENLIG